MESALYLKAEDGAPHKPMVQDVEPETKIIASKQAVGGAVTTVTGALGVVTGFGDSISPVVGQAKEFADNLGVNTHIALGCIAVAVGAMVLYSRLKQRSGGWA
jgi:hypothetical protein